MFSLIICSDRERGIGMHNGEIPFKNSADLKHFKKATTDNIVIMGRKTWDAIPIKYRPLSNRINVIISSKGYAILENETFGRPDFMKPLSVKDKIDYCDSINSPIMVFTSIKECVKELSKKQYKEKEKFVAGGATIYDYFWKNSLVSHIYSTIVYHNFNCEVFTQIPIVDDLLESEHWDMTSFEKMTFDDAVAFDKELKKCMPEYSWTYYRFSYINKEEKQFLNVLKSVDEEGEIRNDRTGTGTKAIFAPADMRFDLTNNNFPLLTTRAMNLRLIFEELMFFLRGQTDIKILEEKKVKIWTPNTTREFLDSRGLQHYDVGDIGATYGFLYRHQGANYINCQTDYTGQGFDQLAEVIRLLKEDPYSRRIMINLWDPINMHKMSLPPCLFNFQFYVSFDALNTKWLSCKITQRSSDISLAGGWNIATGALFTHMLAHVTGMRPKSLIWSPGDTHIYLNQLEGVKNQLSREPRIFPKLYFKKNEKNKETKENKEKEITDFEFTDLELVNYNPHAPIKLAMNA